jgi:Domain of unknown function (DUF6745)
MTGRAIEWAHGFAVHAWHDSRARRQQRRYFLRVPPAVGRARDAVAWTFGLDPEEWQPAAES